MQSTADNCGSVVLQKKLIIMIHAKKSWNQHEMAIALFLDRRNKFFLDFVIGGW